MSYFLKKYQQIRWVHCQKMKYPKNGSYLKMSAINMIFKNQKDSINNFPFFGGSVDHFGKGQ